MRRLLGKIVEWALGYERIIYFTGYANFYMWSDGFHTIGNNVPKNSYSGDAGYDLFVDRNIILPPGKMVDVPSGIRVDAKSNIWFEIKARSSTFHKLGLEVLDAVIDKGYRGELCSVVFNPGKEPVKVNRGDRVCQIVPHLVLPCRFVEGKLRKSDRMACGYGSSGK